MSTWLQPDQLALLISKYPVFIQAQNDKKTHRFWPQVYEIWWGRWPVDTAILEEFSTESKQQFVARVQTAKEKQIHNWFFNRTRGGGGGGGGRGTRTTRMSTGKKRAPLQAYMHYFYKKKIRAQVIRLWKKESTVAQASAQESDLQEEDDNDDEIKEDEDTKGIPFSYKMQISKQMFLIESESVKKEVEERRAEDAAPPELTQNAELRASRLAAYQLNIDRLGRTVHNFLKQLERTTGMSATLLVGGPVPVLGGKISCWSFSSGVTSEKALDFPDFHDGFQKGVMRPFAEHTKHVYPLAIRNARAILDETSDPQSPAPITLNLATTPAQVAPQQPQQTVTAPDEPHLPDEPDLTAPVRFRPQAKSRFRKAAADYIPLDPNGPDPFAPMQGCKEQPPVAPCTPAEDPLLNPLPLDLSLFDLDPIDFSSLSAEETLELLRYSLDPSPESPANGSDGSATPSAMDIDFIPAFAATSASIQTTIPAAPIAAAFSIPFIDAPSMAAPSSPFPPSPSPLATTSPAPFINAPSAPFVTPPSTPFVAAPPSPVATAPSTPFVAAPPSPIAPVHSAPFVAAPPGPVATAPSAPPGPVVTAPSTPFSPVATALPTPFVAPTTGSSRASTSGDSFVFNSSILPDWLGKGLKYLAGLSNDTEWILLLGELLKHEARLGYVVGCKTWVSTDQSPKALDWWQYEGRHTLSKLPQINVVNFPKELRAWWISLQPRARRGTSLLRTQNAEGADWTALQHGGLDGMFAVVMCLSWYMVSLPPPADQRGFDDLVDDVTWVLSCLNSSDEDASTLTTSSRRGKGRISTTKAPEIATSKKRGAVEGGKQVGPVKRGRR